MRERVRCDAMVRGDAGFAVPLHEDGAGEERNVSVMSVRFAAM
jgi:hypothetical protein